MESDRITTAVLKGRLFGAKERLSNKLRSLDLKSIGISEYNQRYICGRVKQIEEILEIYGRLLVLCFDGSRGPLEKVTFIDYWGGSGILSLLADVFGVGEVI
jgi:hypothetical protein